MSDKKRRPKLVTKPDFKQLSSRYNFSKISKGCREEMNRMLLSTLDSQVASSMLKADAEHLKGLNQSHAEHGIKFTKEYPRVFHK